jgi:hypothetical protein
MQRLAPHLPLTKGPGVDALTSRTSLKAVGTGDKAFNQSPSDVSERPTRKGVHRLTCVQGVGPHADSCMLNSLANAGIHASQTVSLESEECLCSSLFLASLFLFLFKTTKPERRGQTPPPMRLRRARHSSPRMNAGVSCLDWMKLRHLDRSCHTL